MALANAVSAIRVTVPASRVHFGHLASYDVVHASTEPYLIRPVHDVGECPNACSSNGVCKLLGDLAGVLTIPYASTNWDVGSIQTCVCDAGYFGADCSQREIAGVLLVILN